MRLASTFALGCSLPPLCLGASLTLTWQDNSDNEDGFAIERVTAGSNGNFAEVGIVAADVSTYTDDGLADGQEYLYRVRAFNEHGYSGYTNVVSGFTGSVPADPASPQAVPEPVLIITVNGDGTITVEQAP